MSRIPGSLSKPGVEELFGKEEIATAKLRTTSTLKDGSRFTKQSHELNSVAWARILFVPYFPQGSKEKVVSSMVL